MNASTVTQTPYERLLLQFAPRAIPSRAQYQRVLRQVDGLMRRPKLTRAEDDLLELLASLVAQYEQTRFPAPDVTPAAMLAHLLKARGATVADVSAATAIAKRTLARFLDGSQPIDTTSRARLAFGLDEFDEFRFVLADQIADAVAEPSQRNLEFRDVAHPLFHRGDVNDDVFRFDDFSDPSGYALWAPSLRCDGVGMPFETPPFDWIPTSVSVWQFTLGQNSAKIFVSRRV